MLETLAIIDLVALALSILGLCITFVFFLWYRHKENQVSVNNLTLCRDCGRSDTCDYKSEYKRVRKSLKQSIADMDEVYDTNLHVILNIKCAFYKDKNKQNNNGRDKQ